MTGSNWNAIMQYSFLRVFANDGTLDAEELAMFERLALADGVVDERERNVLSNVLSRVSREWVSDEVWESLQAFKARHGIA